MIPEGQTTIMQPKETTVAATSSVEAMIYAFSGTPYDYMFEQQNENREPMPKPDPWEGIDPFNYSPIF